jgi:hypothetical protein
LVDTWGQWVLGGPVSPRWHQPEDGPVR